MSEEEIIDYLKESIEHSEYNFENFGENNYFDKSTQNAVKELIDLYNKQKEGIEKLKEHNEELAKFILNSGLEIIKSDKKDMIIDKDKFAKFKIE